MTIIIGQHSKQVAYKHIELLMYRECRLQVAKQKNYTRQTAIDMHACIGAGLGWGWALGNIETLCCDNHPLRYHGYCKYHSTYQYKVCICKYHSNYQYKVCICKYHSIYQYKVCIWLVNLYFSLEFCLVLYSISNQTFQKYCS